MWTQAELEATLGLPVNQFPGPYLEAFTHKSANPTMNYERLEFLGDACLSIISAKFLFDEFPSEQEGFLTRLRTRLTCSTTLAHFAKILGLHRFVIMNGRAMEKQFHLNDKILEDCFESLIGAMYLDLGLAMTKTFFLGLIRQHIDMQALLTDINFKDQLMRHAQQHRNPMPVYDFSRVGVGDNKYMYNVSVSYHGCVGRALHNTKKGAEQKAARLVLLQLGSEAPS